MPIELERAEPRGIALADIVRAARDHWVGAGTLIVLGMVATGLFAFLSDRIYRGQTVLVLETQGSELGSLGALASRVGGLAQLAGVSVPANQSRGELLALLQSRALAERVIVKHGLLQELQPPGSGKTPPSLWKAEERFTRSVMSVAENRLTGVVTVAAEWRDPALAANWANVLVEEGNLVARERTIADAEKSIQFLQKELDTTQSVEMRQAIYRLMEAQLSRRMLASVRVDYAFRVVDPAVKPEKPVRPKRLLLLAAGMLGGMLLAALWIVIAASRPAQVRPRTGSA